MKKKSIFMGAFGLFSLIGLGAALTMAIEHGGPEYWFAAALSAIVFLADAKVQEHDDNRVGTLHIFSENGDYRAVGFEFKTPVEDIVQMSEVKMDVHVDIAPKE